VKNKVFNEFIENIPLHAFINNAAVAYDDLITNLNDEPLLSMYRVNVFTPMHIVKYSIRNMLLHSTKGSIIHISSISAHTGYKGLAMYASTKGALEAFSKNTAREWGEKGIRSNCLVVGFMETDMSSTLTPEQKNRIFQRTSLKKPVDPRSVAETVNFLISEKSESITGQNIFIDNGTI
jgi:3-oxoacyl-[acyl-carrier protein] reductase